jgi:mRNA interferase RelE/StbE
MSYTIELSREAAHDIDLLYRSDRQLFHRIINKIEFLEENPFQGKPLVGNHKGEFSLRVGTCRIIYEISAASQTLYILTAKHRKHVYQ